MLPGILAAVMVIATLIGVIAYRNRNRYHPPPRKLAPVEQRAFGVLDVVDYVSQAQPEVHVATVADVLPGGLAAAMVPVRVDWEASDPAGPDPFYVLRDVNAGGNPVAGTTVLRSVRVPARNITSVEFVITPLDPFGDRSLVSHGMLRFIFREDSEGVLLGPGGDVLGMGGRFPDLILSWEAWRPPRMRFHFMRGMDPDNFDLTLRAYTGHQRFLEDGLGPRDWYCHPLRLPGGEAGFAELLRTTLTLGDGAGRQRIDKLLHAAEDAYLSERPQHGDAHETYAQWKKLRSRYSSYRLPEDPRLTLDEAENNYQTMLRSCATMAIQCINVAVERMIEGGADAQGIRPTRSTQSEPVPAWMRELASRSPRRILRALPQALGYLARNREIVPSSIPGILDRAGLIEHRDGRPLRYKYSVRGRTPYGRLAEKLIE